MENNISVFLGLTPWVFVAILLGILGCLALYKGDYRKFFRSTLFTKTVVWLPLYLVFCFASSSVAAAVIFALLMVAGSLYEWRRHGKASVVWYLVYFLIGCAAIPVSLGAVGSRLWLAVVMASVLSDVAAFFFGKTLGRHRLPRALNNRKSIEGVIGQVVGGTVGGVITSVLFGASIPLWMGVLIGLLSAGGDLANSYTKRRLMIKAWGNTIPGHGGVMDRFSSLNAVIIGITLLVLFA